MKTLLFITTLFMISLTGNTQTIRVMTYNLRLDTPVDSVNQWGNRKQKVYNLLKKYQPDIVGVQEGLHHQLEDIATNMSHYSYVGAGRDDGKMKGEYSAIFYSKEKFDVIDQKTFWLSETPEVPGSKNWDAAITRVATWAILKDKKTKKQFFILNTHFDHIGREARLKSTQLIKKRIAELAGKLPVIVTGDLNSEPNEPPYLSMIDASEYTLKDAGFGSTLGTYCTFAVAGPPCRRIDYVFYSSRWKSSEYQVITDHDGTFYPSDHLPVMSIFALTKR